MFSYTCQVARRAAGPGIVASSLSLCSERRVLHSTTSQVTATFRSASRSFARSNSSTAVSSSSFVAWYERHLSHRPVLTKAVTGCCLWGIGDAVAQFVPDVAAGKPLPEYDYQRTGRACFYGFALHAPLSHLHFNFLEWMTVKGGFRGLQVPIFKTVMEQFVYWSWVSNCLYHGAMGAMQGKTFQQTWEYIQSVIWDTQKAQWIFWIPVQLLNFKYVPVRHQLNVVLCTSIVWTALLSMWYPPLDDEAITSAQQQPLDIPVM